METFDYPHLSVTPFEFSLLPESNSKPWVSPFTKTAQIQFFPGTRWVADVTYPKLRPNDARVMSSFLTKMDGMVNRVRMHNFQHPNPHGLGLAAVDTTITVVQKNTPKQLLTQGWLPNRSNVLLDGDHIGLGNELKKLSADASSDENGQAVLSFSMPLRTDLAIGAPVVIDKPHAVFMMADNSQSSWATRAPHKTMVKFKLLEDITY